MLADFTTNYFYTILDGNGKEISFKDNKQYNIIIDDVLYKTPNIPQDSLKLNIEDISDSNENQIRINELSLSIPQNENQIRINDLSLSILQKNYFEIGKQLEIKIIHKKDTMFICQPTASGGYRGIDFTLQYIPGHYYFPKWAKNILYNMPKVSENIKIVNIAQHNFIIPKNAYDSVCYIDRNFENRQNYNKKAENLVLENFMNDYFSIERQIQPTNFDRSLLPFHKPHWSYSTLANYCYTVDHDEYLGVVELSYDTLNYMGGRGILVNFNDKENKMRIWSATDNLMFSSTYMLKLDTFNNIYYQRTIIRDSTCKEVIYNCDFKNKFFRSTDGGKTWVVCKELTQLNEKHEIREFEFLDRNHILIFKLDEIKPENINYQIQQGTYYLLEDFIIIDSLKTPTDIHYNSNYNHYSFKIKDDTASLGNWSYGGFQINHPYFEPRLIKIDYKWDFQVVEKIFFRTRPVPEEIDSITYQNFKIVNNKELVLRNKGSLVFQDDLSELHKKGLILENGKQIYLIGLTIGTLFSFDGGNNWYVYPIPFETNSLYQFLKINEQSDISYLKNNMGENELDFNKVFIRFKLNF